ncbi:MAG: efflux RND transporter permease subunit [Nitrospirae bacterium]|nr:efflux RND transporter permease subunit [Nitrospirota bacterium]
MNISEIFIKRPVMTTLVMLSILFVGIAGYRLLPVSDLPNVDFPNIVVTANVPGASPETMASAVATPLEKQFSTIAGIDSMTSVNAQGLTQINIQFNLSRNIDAAAQDVNSAIAGALKQLPQNMPSPPSYRKVNPADQPVLYLALSSPTLPLSKVDDYAQTLIAQRVSMISGVAQVQVFGSQKYAVRVRLNPRALASKGIGIDEVANAVALANSNLPTGTLYGANQAFTVQTTGQLNDAQAYRPVVVAYRGGSPVRLQELGDVIDSVENDKVASWYRDTRAIILAIQRQPGTNTVEVVDSIKRLIPTFREQMPASVNLNIMFDRSESIRDSVHDVQFTLVLTVCLVVMVIFLFLRNLSATVIPSLALPMAIVGTFAVMYVMDFSMDNMSLMALTLSVGFVVDDAIVMLENIIRHVEMGETVMEAALKGSKEIGFTILSMTISLVAVFLPVFFMGGIIGRLLHEFAVTIGMSILISGFVSLTLTPMLASRFVRPHTRDEQHGKLYQMSEQFFTSMLEFYERTLTFVLLHRRMTMIVSGVILAATVVLFKIMPTGFLPSEDTGALFITTEAAQGISFDSMKEHQQALAAIVLKDENVEGFMSSMGVGGSSVAGNQGRIFMKLKPRSERKLHVDQVIQKFRPLLAQVPGIQAFPQNPPPIRIGGTLTKSLYQLTLQSPDTAELYTYTPKLEAKLRELPLLQDVTSDLQIKNPQVNVEIDRDKASALGISAAQVESGLSMAYSAQQVSTIYAPNNQYQVIMQVLPEFQMDPAALSLLYIRSSSGQLVPLSSVSKLSQNVGPLTVNHLGQLPAVTLSFNTRPDVSLGTAVDAVRKAARQVLPASITTSFQGTAQAFQSSMQGLGLLLIAAMLVIYIVLGILYESFIHPLTILSALPFAGFGALVTLLLFGSDLNVYAFVGIILLVGLVKKNGIMMIDFALDAQRREAATPHDAIYKACIVRFRPIMMTTMAALLGTLPIALGFGAGAESRRPLGLAVVGGLLFSQTLTLYVTPVVYLYMDSMQRKLSKMHIFQARKKAVSHE